MAPTAPCTRPSSACSAPRLPWSSPVCRGGNSGISPISLSRTHTPFSLLSLSFPSFSPWRCLRHGQVWHGYRRHVRHAPRAHHEVHHSRRHGRYHCHLRPRRLGAHCPGHGQDLQPLQVRVLLRFAAFCYWRDFSSPALTVCLHPILSFPGALWTWALVSLSVSRVLLPVLPLALSVTLAFAAQPSSPE